MSITVKHYCYPSRGLEVVKLTDGHARSKVIQVPFTHPDIDAFIQKEIDEFAAQEAQFSRHIESRFNPETLERK